MFHFISAAHELSGGSITIEPFLRAGDGTELGFEPGALTRILDGELEMTLIGARGFDSAGIDSFLPLMAPFLIDDDALAVAVAESDVATEMKATVEPAPGAVAWGTAPVRLTIEAATGPTPVDGTYVTHVSFDELASSPLLYDPGEINAGSWGDIVVTFDSGEFSLSLENPNESYETSGVYRSDGDLLTLFDPKACCPTVPFAYHWQLEGDQLTFTRVPDEIGPTTWLINAWTKVED